MYRTSSPIFDVPEFPPLRRVKPLPKRKRVHPPSESDYDFKRADDYPTQATVASRTVAPVQPRLSPTAPSLHTSLSGRKGDGTSPPEKAGAQADRISAQLDYYKATILGDLPTNSTERQQQDLYDDDDDSPRKKIATQDAAGIPSIHDIPLAAFGIYVSNANSGPVADGSEGIDEDHDEGDYVDHLQQHGNTKKRKVPANMSGGGRHGHRGDAGSGDNSGADDDDGQGGFGGSGGLGEISRGIPTGRPFEHDHPSQSGDQGPLSPSSTSGLTLSLLPGRKLKMSAATRAGLQHKEVLKSRKKQLAAVLGALSHGDTLALDQALSARYPYGLPGELKGALVAPKTRLSKRKGPRILRELRAKNTDGASETDSCFPSGDFSFIHESATSDRLRATREEVAVLHNKFEAELARQAAKSVEVSRQATTAVGTTSSNLKRSAPSNKRPAPGRTSNTKPIDPPPEPPVSTKKGKKKKRPALANASNPHHLRNYVPSRLPNSGQASSTQNANSQNYLSPPPLQFLSARLPPRRKRYGDANAIPTSSTLTNPAEEWICPFCEYKLFYGDEVEYQRAIRNRKKILKRRRRAQERAAAAASGKSASNAAATEKSDVSYDDENREAGYEGPYAKDAVQGQYKPPRWKATNSTADEGVEPITAGGGA
ncbi:hypothetical protein BDM02DRAFT_3268911 [Thelephora ganbajun]|uniref:Uncharacterized protein n=1 Tax=Thelephora ganbajun TaxID=370292 RepID=A0ACB6ZHF5_THEGA|nr:hypothetical protein BDM02DRAFT_3268911 [Thelephora ganbajun]